MRKSNLLKKVVAIASALVLATVSVPMINGAMDVKAATYDANGSYTSGTWTTSGSTSTKVTSWDFTTNKVESSKTFEVGDSTNNVVATSGIVALHKDGYLKLGKGNESGATIRIPVSADAENVSLEVSFKASNARQLSDGITSSEGTGSNPRTLTFTNLQTDGTQKYIELSTVAGSDNKYEVPIYSLVLTETKSVASTSDTTNKYAPTYVQYKAEDGGSYSIRIVYEIKAVYGEDKVLTNYTNLGAHLKVGSFEEDYYSTDGAKVYSKIMANGQEVSPTGDNNAFVVIEITGVPSNAEIGFSAIQQGGSDINASATIKMAEII